MSSIAVARGTSRLVRLVVLSFVVSLLPAIAVVQHLTGTSVLPDEATEVSLCAGGPCRRDVSPDVVALVGDLTQQGMTCSVRPQLTDTVVVEWLSGGVQVVPFDQALEVAAQRRGWLRSYCVPSGR